MKKNFTALIILDGYGLSDVTEGNAIVGNSPFVDGLRKKYPWVKLNCSGEAVGLPEGQMGNSEVGHLNMGAGRVVFQELPRITNAIKDGSFYLNPALVNLCKKIKTTGGDAHIMGLVSDGGVHSSMQHLFALIDFFKAQEIKQVYIHCYLDGRDVGPTSALTYLNQLQSRIDEVGFGKIATVCGRYYAMDRDNRWDRVEKAYDMLALGKGKQVESYERAIKESYADGVTDEFVLPTVITTDGKPTATIKDGDGVVFFNFRSDRPREMTRAFTEEKFDGFDRTGKKRDVTWVCMTEYDKSLTNVDVAFKPNKPKNTLGYYLSKLGKKQLRIAETEKYAHVTFFFNGGEETPNEGEERILVASPKVSTYDLKPEMSAPEVTDRAIERLKSDDLDVMILNFANCDMVGHTGVFEAAQKAVRTVDGCVERLVNFIVDNGGCVFVTADHGNAEKMLDENGNVHSAHTTNPVPFIFVNANKSDATLVGDGKLCDVAPTLLACMGLPVPTEMTGKNLLKQ